jgi:outer membrane receptor protein involved in Fe transport
MGTKIRFGLFASLTALIPFEGAWAQADSALPEAKPTPPEAKPTGGALSQAKPTASTNSEEAIVVTAQRREENLKRVPISISVLSGKALDSAHGSGLAEELQRVPGVVVDVGANGTENIAIRGVEGNGFASGGSATAYYLDSVPFVFIRSSVAPDSSAYDLARVEVLRGPQGVLYGAAALNGVVRVISNDPDLDDFDIKSRIEGVALKDGQPDYGGDAAVNVPLIDGTLGARFVGGYHHFGGWIDTPLGHDVNREVTSNLRGKLSLKVSNFSAVASVWRSHIHYDAQSLSDENYKKPSATQFDPSNDDFTAYGLKLSNAFETFNVTSATSYINYKRLANVDFSSNIGVPFPILLSTNDGAKTFSEELSLNSTTNSSWQWSAGSLYRRTSEFLFQNILGILPAPLNQNDEGRSIAVFGQVTKAFWGDRLTFSGGLRYFRDNVTLVEKNAFLNPGGPPLPPKGHIYHALTPRLVATWRPDAKTNIYASYSEGFRSGFEQNVIVNELFPTVPPARPDKLDNYEVGAKGSLLGDLIDYEIAAYYMIWKDAQRTIGLPFLGTTVIGTFNAGRSSGPGIDAALSISPLKGLRINTTMSWNDLKSDEDVLSAGFLALQKGKRLPDSVPLTLGGSVDYSRPLGSGWRSTFNLAANYTSPSQSLVSVTSTSIKTVSSEKLIDLRASLTLLAPSHWTIGLFGENLLNERGGVAVSSILNDHAQRPRPRTIGVQISYSRL